MHYVDAGSLRIARVLYAHRRNRAPALAIAVGDQINMFENSIYSVISPEGCASILWHDAAKAEQAAEALRITAKDLSEFGIVDEIVPEPEGGAHTDHAKA